MTDVLRGNFIPRQGLSPAALPELLGRTSVAKIPAGTMLRRELFA